MKLANRAEVSEKFISVDELIAEATCMWKEFKDPPTHGDEKLINDKLEEMVKTHRDFMTSHRVIGKYIAELQWFSVGAVKKYGEHILKHPWKSLDDMLESQAVYGMYLSRARGQAKSLSQLSAIKKEIKALLREEHETNLELYKLLAERRAEFAKRAAVIRQQETIEYCKKYGEEIVDIPITAEWNGESQPAIPETKRVMIPMIDVPEDVLEVHASELLD